MAEIIRREYLDRLFEYKDQDVVKVIIGMRRVGKTTLLAQFRDELSDRGVRGEDIIHIDMESFDRPDIGNARDLYDYVRGKYCGSRLYVIIDEVQLIDDWQRAVNALRKDIDCDIFLTGSNSAMLSTEISTLITGRAITLLVLPLSFRELRESGQWGDGKELYERYYTFGGLPFITPDLTSGSIMTRISGIKADILVKDIRPRIGRIDVGKLENAVNYLFSEIGNPISLERMAAKLKVSASTASEYLERVTDSMMFMKAERFDIRGKAILSTVPKYYCTDLGMRTASPLPKDSDRGRVLENIVFLELVRRGGRVYVGKDGDREIDFVVIGDDRTDYYQVTYSLADPQVRAREYAPLKGLSGRGERYIITGDGMPGYTDEYAVVMDVVEFLSQGKEEKEISHADKGREALVTLIKAVDSYAGACREALIVPVSLRDFDTVSFGIQRKYFDMRSAFKDPGFAGRSDIKECLDDITDAEVEIFYALMACANSNGWDGRGLTPAYPGAMRRITDVHERLLAIAAREARYTHQYR